jgi:hypothetical protein
VDEETIVRIRERVLAAENEQRHLEKPHNILPEIRSIIEEEIS